MQRIFNRCMLSFKTNLYAINFKPIFFQCNTKLLPTIASDIVPMFTINVQITF